MPSSSRITRLDEFAAAITRESRKELRRGDARQWYFTCSVRIPGVDHKVRIVVLWNHRRDSRPCKILVTNRTRWEVTRIVRGYRCRWKGMSVDRH